jgi:hypothetical protein
VGSVLGIEFGWVPRFGPGMEGCPLAIRGATSWPQMGLSPRGEKPRRARRKEYSVLFQNEERRNWPKAGTFELKYPDM